MIAFIKSIPGKVWMVFVAVLGFVLFFWKEKQVEELKSEALLSDSKQKDAVLANDQAHIVSEEEQVKRDAEAKKSIQVSIDQIAKDLNNV